MSTSLAALAASSNTHSPSTVLMSTSNQTNSYNQPSISSPPIAANTSSVLLDVNDSNYEIKTEFYTREGVWKMLPNCEYVRQLQQAQAQSQMQNQQTVSSPASSNNQLNNISQQQAQNAGAVQSGATTPNDPVKVGVFKYTNKNIFRNTTKPSPKNAKKIVCTYCNKEQTMTRSECDEEEDETDDEADSESDDDDVYDESDDYYSDGDDDSNSSDEEVESFKLKEHDDDDDVIFTKLNESEVKCEHCSRPIKLRSKLSRKKSKESKKLKSSSGSANASSLDLLLFNYSREIYFYELNAIRSATAAASSSDQRNLVDKKIYKTFASTCFDINRNASVLNTLALQSNISPMQASKNSASSLNISPSNLSLIVAAGFSKGEIHVFDFFKKEASVFFNNSVNIIIFYVFLNSLHLFKRKLSRFCFNYYSCVNKRMSVFIQYNYIT